MDGLSANAEEFVWRAIRVDKDQLALDAQRRLSAYAERHEESGKTYSLPRACCHLVTLMIFRPHSWSPGRIDDLQAP
jgi:hypothetical protein